MLIIFQLNSNQRKNLILKSSYMDFKLIYEFYALILFSAQRWCRIDAEAYCMFYFLTDEITRLHANGQLCYVNEKAWVKPVKDWFFVSVLIFWLNWNQREDLIGK